MRAIKLIDQDEDNQTYFQCELDKDDHTWDKYDKYKDEENIKEDISKPYVAMRLDYEDPVYKYYNIYARQVGFRVWKEPGDHRKIKVSLLVPR